MRISFKVATKYMVTDPSEIPRDAFDIENADTEETAVGRCEGCAIPVFENDGHQECADGVLLCRQCAEHAEFEPNPEADRR